MTELGRRTCGTNARSRRDIDWTIAWAGRYPVSERYQKDTVALKYPAEIAMLFSQLREDYGYSEKDAMLKLNDILML